MRIYYCDWRELPAQALAAEAARLPRAERQRLPRMRRERAAEKLAGRLLARQAVAVQCGIAPETVRFSRSKYGKPYCVGAPAHVSIAHSAGRVACAVSDAPVGLDLERVREIDPAVSRKFCTPPEAAYLAAAPDEAERQARFFRLWTLKEAYLKAEGRGLYLPLKSVTFFPAPDGADGPVRSSRRRWRFTLLRDGDFQFAAAQRAGDETPVTLQRYRPQGLEGEKQRPGGETRGAE